MKKITLLCTVLLAIHFGNSQNTCATAVAVTAGTTTVGTINGTLPSPICAENGTGATNGEWYVYNSTIDGVVNILTDIPANAGGDTRVHIYTGTCAALTCYEGNDDVDADNANYLSSVTFAVSNGTSYYIAFDDRWDDTGFDFVLTEYTPTCDTTLPAYETFDDNINFLGCYTTEDIDGDGISWISQQNLDLDGDTVPETFATNGNSSTGPKNDWLFSPAYNLSAGTSYDITTIFNTFSGNGSLEAFIVDAQSSTATQIASLFSQTNIVPQGVFATLETNAYVQTNTFVPATSGDYYIAYHSFGSGSSGFILLFDSNVEATALSVDEFENNVFNHYYNTTLDILTLKSSISPLSSFQMYNILGQEVLNKSLSQTTETFNLSSFEDGIYFLKVTIENQTESIKLIKQ